ncbi:hypothetical protein BDY17DRAFT_144233 [Neohortaea acidophila]|uniref:Uncharacterized protein n=1 Tax=Neohortaea acidophila TaxID=245834 RepID=A0A6A6PTN9_9PEZI|nr:uncharacterized protein BDY17DRAFT_144233 [Neohortaea acidophila]KAF2483255.1 hypothetical protein BDY17DRAFT_144233 [Neohortaea acidophila]
MCPAPLSRRGRTDEPPRCTGWQSTTKYPSSGSISAAPRPRPSSPKSNAPRVPHVGTNEIPPSNQASIGPVRLPSNSCRCTSGTNVNSPCAPHLTIQTSVRRSYRLITTPCAYFSCQCSIRGAYFIAKCNPPFALPMNNLPDLPGKSILHVHSTSLCLE